MVNGEWRKMERKWAEHLEDGKVVEVEILIEYDEKCTTPKRFIAKSKVDGIQQKPKKFKN
ncbi:DNA/RNA non-specific endonuclease [Pseudoalteromonas sp. SWXJZ94C]|uniref:DNA/RNA non-specific endonuclease n=1 Tax=Pseudoalteromonas sp. SWXJZ94C TaxID=2792065 RepID=UPI0018CDFD7A|nr:DNA/RNA non-specific endonuclease [Pseudoalteromonas sp. SWXJZ94C]MBH0059515.1 DNA/RNA non-specific endonuclease [Pseudoalteromonas sp. SWXJZ94C]